MTDLSQATYPGMILPRRLLPAAATVAPYPLIRSPSVDRRPAALPFRRRS